MVFNEHAQRCNQGSSSKIKMAVKSGLPKVKREKYAREDELFEIFKLKEQNVEIFNHLEDREKGKICLVIIIM